MEFSTQGLQKAAESGNSWNNPLYTKQEIAEMKQKPELSIIVPVYNVEEYLDRCIRSVLRQSFNNFELLLIDDGSEDRSGRICDLYADKDSRVRVLHKENEGVSIARNMGMMMARAEYIAFVDADDELDGQSIKIDGRDAKAGARHCLL